MAIKKETAEKGLTRMEERWFDTIDMMVTKKSDGTFNPSLKEFLETHFKGDVDDMRHIFADRMMATEDGFITMVNRISEFYEVPAELVRNEILEMTGSRQFQVEKKEIKEIQSIRQLLDIMERNLEGELTEQDKIDLQDKAQEWGNDIEKLVHMLGEIKN